MAARQPVEMTSPMILIMGCTASGKSLLAFELARNLNGEILSVDSMKVYRRMDIGTAKPSAQQRRMVCHHLIDVVEPHESFSLGNYMTQADAAIKNLQDLQRPIIAAGGTGMYIKGLLQGIFDGPPADPEIRTRLSAEANRLGCAVLHERLKNVDPVAAERIHVNDAKRLVRALEVYELTGEKISSMQQQFEQAEYQYPWLVIELRRDKDDNSRRINQRVKKMVESGLVDEVEQLMKDGLSPQAGQAVGYAEIIEYFNGQASLDEAIEQIKVNTRRLAKRQRTWFRSICHSVKIDVEADATVEDVAEQALAEIMAFCGKRADGT